MRQENTNEAVEQELLSLAEQGYQKFTAGLIPGVKNMLGIRVPMLREIAKRIAKEDAEEYLSQASDAYFETIMIQGFVIGYRKADIDTILSDIENFIPKIDNWSVCDMFCNTLKITRKHQEKVYRWMQKYLNSQQTYEIRFGIVMILNYFVDETYLEEDFKIFDRVNREDYYVKMAVAWAVSVCFVRFPERTMEYLQTHSLDEDTYRKALQKIVESYRVSREDKERIQEMRRR